MFSRILVAIDDSNTSLLALDRAIVLAKALNAQLCVAHAADEGLLQQHAMGIGTFIDINQARATLRDVGQKLLDEARARAAQAGVQADQMLLESGDKRVAEQIVEAAEKWKADLVVAGTHGRRGFERLLVGSVAENLVRLAHFSLLLVRNH